MYKFRKFNLDPKKLDTQAIGYYIEIIKLAALHREKLFDDFMLKPLPEHVCELAERYSPYFWVVTAAAGSSHGQAAKRNLPKGASPFCEDSVEESERGSIPREPERESVSIGDVGAGTPRSSEGGRRSEHHRNKKDEHFCGFVYLYDLIGDENCIHAASIATCFVKSHWGKAARQIGRMFLNYCFKKLCISKLKAECFASNHYVEGFLRNLKFKKEGILKNETLVGGRGEDLVLWAKRQP